MGGKKKQTVGHRYYLGVHMAVCHGPVDEVTDLFADERHLGKGRTSSGEVYVDKPNLFGGDDREGGIAGRFDLLFGEPDQPVNPYMQKVLEETDIPAWRGVLTMVAKQIYTGTTSYLKPIYPRVRRIMKRSNGQAQWQPNYARIGDDMNPAHIVRECLTDTDWGMGYPESSIDDAAFLKAAKTLVDEKFGLSLIWDKQKEIGEFIALIMDHVGGVLYVDKSTGLFNFKLLRADYDETKIPMLGEDDIIDVSDFVRPNVGELTSQVTVKFYNRKEARQDSITVQDIALSRQQGSPVGITRQYPGINTPELANVVATRELKAVTTPLIGCTIKCNRIKAAGLTVGSPFILNWPDYGIASVVMRVSNIGYGTATNGEITIDCMQDVFGLGTALFVTPPDTEWKPPSNEPSPVNTYYIDSTPFREIIQRLGTNFDSKNLSGREYVMGCVARPTADAIDCELWVDEGGYQLAETLDFVPHGKLTSAVDQKETTLQLNGLVDADLVSMGTAIAIDAEYMKLVSLDTTTGAATVERGVMDTVPASHALGSVVYFFDDFAEMYDSASERGLPLKFKLLPSTLQGRLELDKAPQDSYTPVRRWDTPYPPGNVKLNGGYFPDSFSGDITLTWSHRDRIQQQDKLYGFTAGNIGPEAGTTYTVRVYDHNASQLIKQETGITGTSFTLTKSEEGVDANQLPDLYRFEIEAVRDGIKSFQHQLILSTRTDRDIPFGIGVQPQNQTVALGRRATFTAKASGWKAGTDSVKWQLDPPGGAGWADIPGATSPTYTTDAVTAGDTGSRYRAVFTRASGGSVTTNAASLTVTQ
ncbi:tail assembly protein [Vibrio phage vB_VnaS-AQKL99]|nr:tail assembly protein [Vibrio phage vB_VnaS-AQKL99]